MAISLLTENKLEYVFYPASGGQIQFRIKAPNDAHVALTTGATESEPMYEVFIGGWGNSKSVIRKNRSKPEVAEMETPGILSNDEHRGFWIRWTADGNLAVGKEGEPSAFLNYYDPEAFPIKYFGVCTGWGASGDWLIEDADVNDRVPSAPSEVTAIIDWRDASGGQIPPGALEGGQDDGEPLYVGRANHEGELIPGKVKPSHAVCYIAWGGEEHAKSEYQVLCGCNNVSWIATSGGEIPPNAYPSGSGENGETLYVGRVNHEGTLTIGKVQPSHNVCYIPFAGAEIGFPDYEILTMT